MLKECIRFYKLASELQEILESTDQFVSPTPEDELKWKFLMNRASKEIDSKNYPKAIQTLVVLDRFLRDFKPESLEPTFFDFATEEVLWKKINELSRTEEYSERDIEFLGFINELLKYFKDEKLIG